MLKLLGLAALLEATFLALYPLFSATFSQHDPAERVLLTVFPWLPRLYWTTLSPPLAQFFARVPFLDPLGSSGVGRANLLLLLLALAFLLVLLAARVGRRVLREAVSRAGVRAIFWTILVITALFGVTYLTVPGLLSRDLFLYDFYGRAAALYHINPYAVPAGTFDLDPLHAIIINGVRETVPYGPVWLDLCIPVVLFARDSVANALIGFRLLGLAAHLANVILIWIVLAKIKPELRISGTLLYAWNPLVLLLGVAEPHRSIVVLLFVLLATLFFQRKSFLLCWVFLLLAVLIDIFCLLLLPLFFHLLWREARTMRWGSRFLWWLAVAGTSVLVVALAYAPYWQGWGFPGLLAGIQQTFLQDSAANSLDAALLHLPVALPPALAWLVAPHHWTIFAIAAVALFLLVGAWLADTLALALLFSSWLFLALLALLPASWPWYVLLPLVLAICAAGRRTLLLALLLSAGGLVSYYCLLWHPAWSGMALLTVGLPLLLWGWILFFTSTWQMVRPNEPQPLVKTRGPRSNWPSRPSWSSRPSRPSQGQRGR